MRHKKNPGDIHTNIPDHYAQYALKHNLKWCELLIKAIEQEMNQDPEYIQKKIQKNKTEHEELVRKLETAKKRNKTINEQMKSITEGLIPVE